MATPTLTPRKTTKKLLREIPDASELMEMTVSMTRELRETVAALDPLANPTSDFLRKVRKCQDVLLAMVSAHAYAEALKRNTTPP